jgi:hypothetical protein
MVLVFDLWDLTYLLVWASEDITLAISITSVEASLAKSEQEVVDAQFGSVCEQVRHEDELVNQRTSWTLVFHGLLFSAFVGGIGLLEKLQITIRCFNVIGFGLGLLCILGIGSAIAAYVGVKAAEDQRKIVSDWWVRIRPENHEKLFPPIYIHSESKSSFGASIYFIFLAIVWVVFLILVASSGAKATT